MRKITSLCLLTLLTIFLVLPAIASSAEIKPDFSKIYLDANNYTVFIMSADIDQPKGGEKFTTGTGWVIKINDRYIVVTVSHIIPNAVAYVQFNNQTNSLETRRIGYDNQFDLAILEFTDKNFIPPGYADLGDSDKLKVIDNERFYVLGNPLGLKFLWSEGKLMKEKVFMAPPMISIAIDITCNPGNSGSAVINEWGKVIGLVDALGGDRPICFVIPINTFKTLLPELEKGEVKHGSLGVGIANTWDGIPDKSSKLHLENTRKGVAVKSLVEDSPGKQAGIEPNDIILGFISKKGAFIKAVETSEFVERLNLNFFAGDKVTLRILRGKQTMEKQATMAEAKPTPPMKPTLDKQPDSHNTWKMETPDISWF